MTFVKKISFAFLLYLLVGPCFCQVYPVTGKVLYNVVHAFDSTSDRRFSEVAVLYYGKDATLYKSYDRELGEASAKAEGVKVENGFVKLPTPAKGSKDAYYSFPSKKELSRVRDFFGEMYRMPEPLAIINWKISGETKTLGGYTCQKATGNCKGRNFVVWFCSDLPYRYGPWKLNGLPGLILEAIDEKGKLAFYFNKVEKVNDAQHIIELPVKVSTLTDVNFEKIRKAYYDRPKGDNSGLVATSGGGSGGPVVPQRSMLINNPLDKESKALPMPYNF